MNGWDSSDQYFDHGPGGPNPRIYSATCLHSGGLSWACAFFVTLERMSP